MLSSRKSATSSKLPNFGSALFAAFDASKSFFTFLPTPTGVLLITNCRKSISSVSSFHSQITTRLTLSKFKVGILVVGNMFLINVFASFDCFFSSLKPDIKHIAASLDKCWSACGLAKASCQKSETT